jgi:hypothetical protein
MSEDINLHILKIRVQGDAAGYSVIESAMTVVRIGTRAGTVEGMMYE